jgi:prevent-host-death family protein
MVQNKRDAKARATAHVTASEMKNHWHEYLERVSQGRQEIVVTRYGEPIAKLTPADPPERGRGIVGFLAGTVTVKGDIIGPTGEPWESDA